ncbi:hypothetical protein V7S43_009330 [Phytophthora oleae]|uniref:HAT C-terminal dimerisation domain-containing protein n=1 Tax=Phytophthora oleae TaxID=2107226 RepID=A0ABD3FG47_9STRA
MAAVETQPSDSPSSSVALVPPPAALFSEEVAEQLAETIAKWQQASARMPPENSLNRIEEELGRWRNSNTRLQTLDTGVFEDASKFRYRQSQEQSYRISPLAVHVIFLMPSSSGQLEKDFGVARMMVRKQRSSLDPHNIDMATFLNCNRDYVDITQCAQLKPEVARENSRASVLLELQQEFENDVGALEDLFPKLVLS